MRRAAAGALLVCAWIAALLVRLHAAGGAQAPASVRVDYTSQVQPILEAYCLECHSTDKRKGGLALASYEDVLEGGRSGPAVRPGNGAGSLLVHRVSAQVEPQMPLDELPLSEAELATLRLWIDEGARRAPDAPPAPAPWDAPLALVAPAVPDAVWAAWSAPVDRYVSQALAARGLPPPALVSDARFVRRAHLDIWGLLPGPEAVDAFVRDTAPDKRARLVRTLLTDGERYAEGWMPFWNDLLRNEDGVTYFSEDAGRQSITGWLRAALAGNLPYDRFVRALIDPREPSDPAGFLTGVNWRGETSAAVTPWMQAAQNTAQVFLGVNMKCNACHDSFVSRWKLKDAYALAAFFSPEPRLQLFRCDLARDEFTGPGFLFPELDRAPPSGTLADRRATAAAIFIDPRNGRLPRTIVNRVWTRLMGRGLVPVADEMDGKPWNPELLDWLASDFVAHGYDLQHLIATIVSSRTYSLPAVVRTSPPSPRSDRFEGPEVRPLTAEQFADAIGSLTGEWSVWYPPAAGRPGPRPPTASDPVTSGVYARAWRATSSRLTRALGRPVRDQVISSRAEDATTLQALELVNGDLLTEWVMRGARRLAGDWAPEPASRFNAAVAGRNASPRAFEVDVSGARRVWLLVTDTGSNAPERVLPLWRDTVLVRSDGSAVPVAALQPIAADGLRGPAAPAEAHLRVTGASRIELDLAGQGFVRLRGVADLENPRGEIGSTLNPSLRFFIFDAEPPLDRDRLVPPAPGAPLPAPPRPASADALVHRLFLYALGRPPAPIERQTAVSAISRDGGGLSADGVADLLWALLVTPEFRLVY